MSLFLKAILGFDGSGFELGIKRAQATAQKFQTSLRSSINSRVGQFLTAAAAEEAVRRTVAYAGAISDLSQRLGISTDALQQWEFAATQAGGKAENVAQFFEALAAARQSALSGGPNGEKDLAAFGRLGVSKNDLQNLNLQDIGKKIGNSIQGGDVQKLVASLKEVGGRGSVALIAAFKAGLQDAFDQAPIMRAEDIIRLDMLGDQVAKAGKTIMSGFAPILTSLGQYVLGMFDGLEARMGAIAAFAGTLFGGGSFSDALAAGSNRFMEGMMAATEREKQTQKAIEAEKRKATTGSSDATPMEEGKDFTVAEAKSKKQSGLNINALQEIGALVSSSGVQGELAKNTNALNKLTEAVKKGARPNNWKELYPPNLKGGGQDDVRFA